MPQPLAFKKQNDEMAVAMRGKMPDATTLAKSSSRGIMTHEQAGTLVQDGKVLYELGKLEEAEAKLNEALKLDPDNTGAYYYLQLVKQPVTDRDEHKAYNRLARQPW
jgi:tetratricopeptide (TPR) repeat protein